MASQKKEIDAFLKRVRRQLRDAGSTRAEERGVLESLREHIDEALTAGAALPDIIASLDPPSAYADSPSPAPGSVLFASIGLILGSIFFLVGFLLVPSIFPESRDQLGNPLILVSAMVLLSAGFISRHFWAARACRTFGVFVVVLIIVGTLFG